MPVHCSIDIEPLSTEAFRELDYKVMRHAFESQNDLGRLADERIYQNDLAERLRGDGIPVMQEIEVILSYEEYRKSLYLDLVVANQGIYELKVAKAISDAHVGQLLTYLLLLDLPRGKLLNFGSSKVESRFVNAPFRTAQRRSFRVVDNEYQGPEHFKNLVVGLLRDWGTALTISLYQDALIVHLGGYDQVDVMMSMQRDKVSLGNQRFYLVTPESAFKITSLNRKVEAFEQQLARLIHYSPLNAIHWVNVGQEEVMLKTVLRGVERVGFGTKMEVRK